MHYDVGQNWVSTAGKERREEGSQGGADGLQGTCFAGLNVTIVKSTIT